MVAVGGTNSVDIVVDSDSATHIIVVVHTEVDPGYDTNWEGNAWANMMLVLVHPESTHHSSSGMCRSSFPSRVGMLCNPSLRALLNYKIYRTGLL